MTLEPDAARPARRRFSALLTTDGALDLAERAGVLLLFAVFVHRMLPRLAGLLVQISGKLALWRRFGLVRANRGVKTGGLYRFVRQPIYAGYTLTHIGFLIGFPSLQNSLLYAAVLAIKIARLTREEGVLQRDPAYQAYATRVRYRLLPGAF